MRLSVRIQSDRICASSDLKGLHTKSTTGENLTLRSFFSLAVSFAFGPFFLGAEMDLCDEIPVVAVTFPEKVVSTSDTVVLSAVAMASANCASRVLAAFLAFKASIAALASCSVLKCVKGY